MDMTLPFGLRSTPKIFTALADTAEWIVIGGYWACNRKELCLWI